MNLSMKSHPRRTGLRAWVGLTALLLIGLWLPATSHDWLESVAWIHAHDDFGQEARHEAADGYFRVEQGLLQLKAPVLAAPASPTTLVVGLDSRRAQNEPPPLSVVEHSTAPPELTVSWLFSRRTAGPNRAPPSVG